MVDNTTILAAAYLEGTTDFQQRVPDPSQHSVAQVSKFLFSPMNKKYLNEFMDIFVNRIAGQLIRQRTFTNPLKRKREDILFGTTIQEIELDFIKAHAYRDDWGHRVDDITNLLKVYRPDGQVAYHSVNRYDQYPISINTLELRGAFSGAYGLNQLAIKIMNVPYNSAEYDEYCYYKELIGEHDTNHGFFKHQCTRPTNETTGKAFLRALRIYADKFTIPNKLYNAADADVPVWVNEEELSSMVLYIEADAKASLDVDTLSSVFNLDKAEVKYRIQFIDSIPIPGAFALLTTDDFFVCADYDISNESFRNPQTRTETWYYTVIGLYSTSPFVPAVLFGDFQATGVPTITESATGLTITPATANVEQGGQLALVTTLQGSLSADPLTYQIPRTISVAPDSCTYNVVVIVEDEPYEPANPADCYVDRFGILHVGTTIPVGATINVVTTTTMADESFATGGTYTVVAPS